MAGGEYLPYDRPDAISEEDYQGIDPVFPEGVSAQAVIRGALSVQFTAANSGEEPATVLLPLFAYPGYALTDSSGGAEMGRQDGYLTVTLPAGYSGTVTVRFAGFWFWRLADAASLVCIAGTLAAAVRRRRRTGAAA